jgi:hypothetical protein
MWRTKIMLTKEISDVEKEKQRSNNYIRANKDKERYEKELRERLVDYFMYADVFDLQHILNIKGGQRVVSYENNVIDIFSDTLVDKKSDCVFLLKVNPNNLKYDDFLYCSMKGKVEESFKIRFTKKQLEKLKKEIELVLKAIRNRRKNAN